MTSKYIEQLKTYNKRISMFTFTRIMQKIVKRNKYKTVKKKFKLFFSVLKQATGSNSDYLLQKIKITKDCEYKNI